MLLVMVVCTASAWKMACDFCNVFARLSQYLCYSVWVIEQLQPETQQLDRILELANILKIHTSNLNSTQSRVTENRSRDM